MVNLKLAGSLIHHGAWYSGTGTQRKIESKVQAIEAKRSRGPEGNPLAMLWQSSCARAVLMSTLLRQAAQAFFFFALCFTSGSYVDLNGKLLQEAASEAVLQIILMECLVWDTLNELCEKRFSPHLCVGFLFLILYPAASSSSASAAFTLSHTIFHTQLCHTPPFTPSSFTNNFVTHHLSPHHLSRATLSHTIFHKQLCHTPSFTTPSFTRNFDTHTQLCHTPSFTHNFVTDHLSPHHISHTTLSHTIFYHTIFHTQLQPWFCVARVALGDIDLRFAWQAWHLATSTLASRGRRGTWQHPPWFRVARLALGDIDLVLRGRRGPGWHPPSFCVAGAALGDMYLRFAWQARRWVTSTFVLRGRRGTCGTGLALVALSHTALSHTICHTQLCRRLVCHTQLVTDSLSHTTLSHAHNFVTLHLSHATLSQTICHTPPCHTQLCHTQLCHTPSFTHIWLSVDAVWSLIVLTDLQTVTFVAHAQRWSRNSVKHCYT